MKSLWPLASRRLRRIASPAFGGFAMTEEADAVISLLPEMPYGLDSIGGRLQYLGDINERPNWFDALGLLFGESIVGLDVDRVRALVHGFVTSREGSIPLQTRLSQRPVGTNPATLIFIDDTMANWGSDSLDRLIKQSVRRHKGDRGEAIFIVKADLVKSVQLRVHQLSRGLNVKTRVLDGSTAFYDSVETGVATLRLAAVHALLGHSSFGSFSHVNLVSRQGRTIDLKDISLDADWVQQLAIFIVNEVLDSISLTPRQLNQIDKLANHIASQA